MACIWQMLNRHQIVGKLGTCWLGKVLEVVDKDEEVRWGSFMLRKQRKCRFRQLKCYFSEVFNPLGKVYPSFLCTLHEWLRERVLLRDSYSYQKSEPKQREQAREKGRERGGRGMLYLKSERAYMYMNEREKMCLLRHGERASGWGCHEWEKRDLEHARQGTKTQSQPHAKWSQSRASETRTECEERAKRSGIERAHQSKPE